MVETVQKLRGLLVGAEILAVEEPPQNGEGGTVILHVKRGRKSTHVLLSATDLGCWVDVSKNGKFKER